MLTRTGLKRLYFSLMTISWLLMVYLSFKSQLFVLSRHQKSFYIDLANSIMLLVFVVTLFLFYKLSIGNKKMQSFMDLLWNNFITGTICLSVFLFINILVMLIADDHLQHSPFFLNLNYQLNITLGLIFITKSFFVFKRMILYQKSAKLDKLWTIFEYFMLFSTVLVLFNFPLFESQHFIILGIYGLISLYFSFNLKWIAYLNFKQKWRSIILLFLSILIIVVFVEQLITYSLKEAQLLSIDFAEKLYIPIMIGFVGIYGLSSLLVSLFNLPTSSVFEQKFSEVLIFQRLNETLKTGEDEKAIADIILDGSMTTAFANGGWIEIFGDNTSEKTFHSRNFDQQYISGVYELLKNQEYRPDKDVVHIKNLKKVPSNIKLPKKASSILILPLQTYNNSIGIIGLVKNVKDGFDKEIIEVLKTYIWQGSVAIENARLLQEAIANERYKEEVKIATEFQKRLLPEFIIEDERVEIASFAKSTKEVGGDYFDILKVDDTKTAIIIADVSGHGTKAAFHMAQMKGIFQGLAQLDLSPREFMIKANQALAQCLEKKSFITASIYLIDFSRFKITFCRAGHCPTLFYESTNNKTYYFENKGLGLGIIRNDTFKSHIENNVVDFHKGDILMLYTDGIIEGANQNGEEFGYERLKTLLEKNTSLHPEEILDKTLNDVYEFSGTKNLRDDHTILILKFK